MNKEPFSIEYLKSALSINTHVGCALGCQYCIVDELGANGIEEILTPERAIERLTGSRFFIPGKTPVTLNNRSDPLLPKVRESTFGMLALLNERGYTNPKIIISKLTPTEREVELLDDSIGNNFFFITYSNLPKPIERPMRVIRERTLSLLRERKNFTAIHYWRPLIKGLNDSEETLEEVMNDVAPICDGSVISGIRLNERIVERLRPYGAELSGWTGDTKHKFLPGEIVDRILAIRDRVDPTYQIYKHTSCPISAAQGISDYNFHYLSPRKCVPGCANTACAEARDAPSADAIDSLVGRLGLTAPWKVDGDALHIDGVITEEERSCLSHILDYPVVASEITKTASEEIIRK